MTKPNQLIIEPTQYTPHVLFDVEKSTYTISGRAMLDGMREVHKKILEWFDTHIDHIQTTICINIKLTYIDSTATKMMSNLMSRLETSYLAGQNIEIRWFYNINDDDVFTIAENLTKTKKLPIKIIGMCFEDRLI